MAAPRRLDGKEKWRAETPIAKKLKRLVPEKIYWNWLLKDIDPDTGNKMKPDSKWLPPDIKFPKNDPGLRPGGPAGPRMIRRGKKKSAPSKRSKKKPAKKPRRKKARSAAQKAATARMLAARFGGGSSESFSYPQPTNKPPAASSRNVSKQPNTPGAVSRPYIGPNY